MSFHGLLQYQTCLDSMCICILLYQHLQVFEFIFLAVVLLTCFYLGLKPRDTSASNSLALRDRLKRRA